MDRRERYDRYIKPYAKPLLVLEYLSLPLLSLLIYAFGGSLPLAIVTGLTWLICDGLFTAFTGCSILGIYLRGSPADLSEVPPPFARGKWNYRASWIMSLFFLIFLALCDFMIVYLIPAENTWQHLFQAIFFYQALYTLIYLRVNFLGGKPSPHLRYEKEELVLFGFLLVSMIAIIALLLDNNSYTSFLLIIDLVPAVLVMYYAYKLIVKSRKITGNQTAE